MSEQVRSERSITKAIQKYLKSIGVWEYKVLGTAYSRSGIPDLLCCYRGFFIGFEVKVPGGKPSKLQEYEIEQIRKSGGSAGIVYSIDDVKKAIEAIDKGLENLEKRKAAYEAYISRHRNHRP